MTETELLKLVTDFYLGSRDFNGLPARHLGLQEIGLRGLLTRLISSHLVSVNFGDRHPNPHILAFDPEAADEQIAKLAKLDLQEACLYPTRDHLTKTVKSSRYRGQPFRLMLARGEAQLSFLSFDLKVLEYYRNDPRYSYRCDDISGRISATSEASLKRQLRDADQVVLQTFGFSYNNDMNRAVAVYLSYLARLSPEHQRTWRAHLLSESFKLHPQYHQMSMGHWGDGASLFTSFLAEQRLINEMSRAMGRASFFRKEYTEEARPKMFGFIVRPTSTEFNGFVLLLDKLLSDNINLEFFRGEVELEIETKRKDGKITVKPKGSLHVLEDWLAKAVQFPNPGPKEEMLKTLKRVRKLRQKPAHAIHEDEFNQKYFKDQRQLMIEAYQALRTLRLIFANHPEAKECSVPTWLKTGKIWTY